MLVLVVSLVVVVLALVALGVVAYGVLGARARLAREVVAFDREVRPVLDALQDTAARTGDGAANSR